RAHDAEHHAEGMIVALLVDEERGYGTRARDDLGSEVEPAAGQAALEKADSLEKLPIPRAAGRFARARIMRLRKAMHAFARAFAHQAGAGDLKALRRASKSSPLIHWATRYAAAVIAIDRGNRDVALALIEDAPTWPNESAFRMFDQELRARATV
ncbi:MAG: hypothetical protein ABI551_03235, partial [Polyangiaceae bacterium]